MKWTDAILRNLPLALVSLQEVGRGRGTLQKASAEIERNKHNFVYVKCARAKVFNENWKYLADIYSIYKDICAI